MLRGLEYAVIVIGCSLRYRRAWLRILSRSIFRTSGSVSHAFRLKPNEDGKAATRIPTFAQKSRLVIGTTVTVLLAVSRNRIHRGDDWQRICQTEITAHYGFTVEVIVASSSSHDKR